MESLSNDVLKFLFGKMSMQNRIKMRGVSKRFRTFVNEHCDIHSVVHCSDLNLSRNRWFPLNDLVDLREEMFTHFTLAYPSPMLQELKSIKIQGNLRYIDFIRLERFVRLKALEIGCLEFDERIHMVHLPNLRHLCVFSIKLQPVTGGYLINSLAVLAVYFGDNSINHIMFTNQSNVLHLEFHRDNVDRQDSLRYPNSKIVRCNQVLDLDPDILNNLIINMLQAERIYLNVQEPICLSASPHLGDDPIEFVHPRLKIIHDQALVAKEQRTENRTKSTDIWLNCVRIDSKLPYPGDDCLVGRTICLHYTFFPRLPIKVTSVRIINYSDVMSLVQRFPPMNFVLKYPNISSIKFARPTNSFKVSPVMLFLQHYHSTAIQCLSIEFCEFPDHFYAKLPSLQQAITRLVVLGSERLDFEFLCHLEWLHSFSTNLMSRHMVLDKIDRLNHNGSYEFHLLKKCSMLITKHRPQQYTLTVQICQDENQIECDQPVYDLEDCQFNTEERSFPNLTMDQLRELINSEPAISHWFD